MKGEDIMKNNYGKEDCYQSLENINSWINNSDTKASIMLGITGVILTVILTNNELIGKCTNLFDAITKDFDFFDAIYSICILGALASAIVGTFWLFKVLNPTLKLQGSKNKKKESHIYFGSIADFKNAKDFQNSIKKASDKDILEDLQNQIYVNSIICTDKFNNFKRGLKYSLLGMGFLIILFLLGILIYL